MFLSIVIYTTTYIRDMSQHQSSKAIIAVCGLSEVFPRSPAKMKSDDKKSWKLPKKLLCSNFGNFSNAINEPWKFCSLDNVCISSSCKISI